MFAFFLFDPSKTVIARLRRRAGREAATAAAGGCGRFDMHAMHDYVFIQANMGK